MAIFPRTMPYDEINIIDQSEYTADGSMEISGVPVGPILYCPFVSPRGYGDDDDAVYMTTDRLNKYGSPNFNKYGLSLYIAKQFAAGGGMVLGQRVKPAGAVAAKITVWAETGWTDSPAGFTGKFAIKNVNGTVPAGTTKPDPDGEGDDVTVPNYTLFSIEARGVGEYANNFRLKIEPDNTMNTTAARDGFTGFFYKFTAMEGTSLVENPISFSLVDGYTYDGQSMYIEDVFETNSMNFKVTVGTGETGLDAYISALEALSPTNYLTRNALTFSSDGFVSETSLDSFTVQGGYLNAAGGTELTPGTNVGYKVCQNELADAYQNAISNKLNDVNRFPFQYLFAPCYPDTEQDGQDVVAGPGARVVAAIHNLVKARKFTHAQYFTDPAITTYADARASLANFKEIAKIENVWTESGVMDFSWKERITSATADIADVFSGKRVKMPSTYFDAYGYPNLWINDKGRAYAGVANYSWTGFRINSLSPVAFTDTELINNSNARLNTIMEDGAGRAYYYEQVTAQNKNSMLSEINNSITLCEMIKIALKTANDTRWTDLGDEEVSVYKDIVKTNIESALAKCYESVEVTSSRETVNGAGRNRIYCRLNVKFKNMLKGVSYEFYILAN